MKKLDFFKYAVLTALVVFFAAGCSDKQESEKDDPQTATYTGTSGSTTYKLKITENTAPVAAYATKRGDAYELTGDSKKSTGTVSNVDGNVLTLSPSNSSTTFTTTISGNNLIAIDGIITWVDKTTSVAPGTLTGGGTGGDDKDANNSAQLKGTWVKNGNYAVEFSFNALMTDEDSTTGEYEMGAWSNGRFNGTTTYGIFNISVSTMYLISYSGGGSSLLSGTVKINGSTLTLSGFGGELDGVYTKYDDNSGNNDNGDSINSALVTASDEVWVDDENPNEGYLFFADGTVYDAQFQGNDTWSYYSYFTYYTHNANSINIILPFDYTLTGNKLIMTYRIFGTEVMSKYCTKVNGQTIIDESDD